MIRAASKLKCARIFITIHLLYMVHRAHIIIHLHLTTKKKIQLLVRDSWINKNKFSYGGSHIIFRSITWKRARSQLYCAHVLLIATLICVLYFFYRARARFDLLPAIYNIWTMRGAPDIKQNKPKKYFKTKSKWTRVGRRASFTFVLD